MWTTQTAHSRSDQELSRQFQSEINSRGVRALGRWGATEGDLGTAFYLSPKALYIKTFTDDTTTTLKLTDSDMTRALQELTHELGASPHEQAQRALDAIHEMTPTRW